MLRANCKYVSSGNIAAAINAATLALINAGVAMKDYAVACTAGFIDGKVILDVNYAEEGGRGPVLTIAALPRTGAIALTHLLSRVHRDQYEAMQVAALEGCQGNLPSSRSVAQPCPSLLLESPSQVIYLFPLTSEPVYQWRALNLSYSQRCRVCCMQR